jgi:hypothetical protein
MLAGALIPVTVIVFDIYCELRFAPVISVKLKASGVVSPAPVVRVKID